jgi:hypothetical protein
MHRITPGRPSPSLVVALVALFVSLGGVSYGVATGSIDSREIKNNTIRSKDVRNNNITGKDVRGIRGRDVTDDSLSGRDVLESSLAPVPNATRANSASTVGGMTVRKFAFNSSGVAPSREILNLNGLQLQASCAAGGDLNFTARTTVENSRLYMWAIDTNGDMANGFDQEGEDGGFDRGEIIDIDANVGDGTGDADVGHLEYFQPDVARSVSVQFADDGGDLSTGLCQISGHAVAG